MEQNNRAFGDVMDRIPVNPSVAGELLRLCRKDSEDVDTLKTLIQIDAGLLGYVLKVSNAAYFGRPGEIATLSEAVDYIGVEKVRDIARGQACYSLVKSPQFHPLDLRQWQMVLLESIIASCIAKIYTPKEAELLQTLTTLSRVGAWQERKLIAEAADSLNGEAHLNGNSEKKLFLNFDQAEFGAIILKKWNLPEQFPIIIRSIPEPMEIAAQPKLFRHLRLVLLARELADFLRDGNHATSDNRRLWDAVELGLCASPEAFITLAGSIRQRVQNYIRAVGALGIRVGESGL